MVGATDGKRSSFLAAAGSLSRKWSLARQKTTRLDTRLSAEDRSRFVKDREQEKQKAKLASKGLISSLPHDGGVLRQDIFLYFP